VSVPGNGREGAIVARAPCGEVAGVSFVHASYGVCRHPYSFSTKIRGTVRVSQPRFEQFQCRKGAPADLETSRPRRPEIEWERRTWSMMVG
jgi:hypothetical protein